MRLWRSVYSMVVIAIVAGPAWSATAQIEFKLTASDAAAGDEFGWSVSINGDYAIVGAYRDDDGGTNSGSAYIFKRDGTSWSLQAKLTASDAAASAYFGVSVSIDGDGGAAGAARCGEGVCWNRPQLADAEPSLSSASQRVAFDVNDSLSSLPAWLLWK